ncbi:hypothetical protein LQ327_28055 [Actinomycetospora endophytica]|uniref:Signal transduction histidine kinase n=1 Tax=Actinomycetospora endophytica TaxID=2291215 RepID=A0ABS8PG50_9PSEU|nr:hypothetical protein [Actinomycetospora endophytica]MCD2197232.1 hypothetical protein [Actinomycetospora endophytica]
MAQQQPRATVGTTDRPPHPADPALGDALLRSGPEVDGAEDLPLPEDLGGPDPAAAPAVTRERARIAVDLRAVVVDALHRLVEIPVDDGDRGPVAGHARAALGATRRAAALGGLPVPAGPTDPTRGQALRPAGLVVGTLFGAAAASLAALVVVLLPATVAAEPLLVVGLAVAVALAARHAPPAASGVVLAAVLGVLALAAPFATTTASTTGAVAGTVDLPVEAAPEPGECLLLGVVLAAAYAVGLHRRRRAIAVGRGHLLHAFDEQARGDVDARLGLAASTHRTLAAELAVLAAPDASEPRRRRIARHRVAAVLPTLAAVDAEPGHLVGEVDAVLDEGRLAVLVASARHAALLGGQPAARHGGRPPSVVVRGVPGRDRPEVGLLAARLLAELVAELASRPGPDAACVTVEHRDDAVVLEVACGRTRVSGPRPGRVPAALAERAALVGGTVEVTSCREALSVRVSLPVAATVPAPVQPSTPPGGSVAAA